ncbi:MFS transporter [Alicyclobacillus acidoterrestris]|uniref:MFS transporter n=1 Tax=Alicyclobacillus acidoterrestris (strain ATCC 49025 / DSM 3922 / CIP 106132 / NCIMB 13137 / GD3B) TaxID=1356854 RepID=T0CIN2_ALIAG|nr:MFS transporter [Alicyclobacillus acidoterrestris]EPZ52649.1 hypothetical protein N007_20035 [Alicyclobacillus acidoterrestris ATCC 49025]UNO49957.1 MFS transporter [Alicyclobacillus acidoterrestris]
MKNKTGILILMCLSMLLSYVPWYNYSAVSGLLSKQYHINPFQSGLILSLFQLGYVIVVPFTGWLADRFGIKLVLITATFATFVFSMLFGLVSNGFLSILILRLLTGMAAGAIYAPGMSLLSNWFEPQRRGTAIGAYTGALTAAYAGGYFLAAPIAASFGWRAGIVWSSLPALIGAILLFWIKESPLQTQLSYDGAAPPVAALPRLSPGGGYAGPGIITLSYCGHMWELYSFWGWIGPAMVASVVMTGASLDHATRYGGILAAIIILIGAPSSYLWGIFADRVGRLRSILISLVCSGIGELLIGWTVHQAALMTLVGFWVGFWVIADSAQYKAGLTEMSEPRVRTTLLGFQSSIGYLMTVFGPTVFGAMVKNENHVVNSADAHVWWPAFSVLAVASLIGIIAALWLRKVPQAKFMNGVAQPDAPSGQ